MIKNLSVCFIIYSVPVSRITDDCMEILHCNDKWCHWWLKKSNKWLTSETRSTHSLSASWCKQLYFLSEEVFVLFVYFWFSWNGLGTNYSADKELTHNIPFSMWHLVLKGNSIFLSNVRLVGAAVSVQWVFRALSLKTTTGNESWNQAELWDRT